MKQMFTKHSWSANYGSNQGWLGISGGNGAWVSSVLSFGQVNPDAGRIVCPIAGTFRHFVVTIVPTSTVTTHPAVVLTLYKNATPTTLLISLSAIEDGGSDLVHSFTVVPGDDVALKLEGSTVGFEGYDIAFNVEFESATDGGTFYGIVPLGVHTGDGDMSYGGALGNGGFQEYISGLSGTYSIASTAGNIQSLYLKDFNPDEASGPGAGIWTAWVIKNTVIQDGAGGTVDTTCILTGGVTVASSAFMLPVVATDHVEILVERTGGAAPEAHAQVGASVSFEATTAGRFMLTGGNNNTLPDGQGWLWIGSQQEATPEARSAVPIGPTSITANGLYVEYTAAPGADTAFTTTLRKSATNTALTVTVPEGDTTGEVFADVEFNTGMTLDLQQDPDPEYSGGFFYWSLAATAATTIPTTITYPLRRVRRFMLPYNENKWSFIHRLEFILQSGMGLNAGQGIDPKVMIRLSRDGGFTWGPEIQLSAGRQGEYEKRVFVTRLGRARNPVVELSVSDPILWCFVDCAVEMEPGTS